MVAIWIPCVTASVVVAGTDLRQFPNRRGGSRKIDKVSCLVLHPVNDDKCLGYFFERLCLLVDNLCQSLNRSNE